MSTSAPKPMIVSLPTEALYHALSTNGWISNKAGFARLLGLCLGNVYNYLPSRAGSSSRKTRPFVPSTETLQKWASIIQSRTNLVVKIVLPKNVLKHGFVVQGFEITGKTKSGQPITIPMVYVVKHEKHVLEKPVLEKPVSEKLVLEEPVFEQSDPDRLEPEALDTSA